MFAFLTGVSAAAETPEKALCWRAFSVQCHVKISGNVQLFGFHVLIFKCCVEKCAMLAGSSLKCGRLFGFRGTRQAFFQCMKAVRFSTQYAQYEIKVRNLRYENMRKEKKKEI